MCSGLRLFVLPMPCCGQQGLNELRALLGGGHITYTGDRIEPLTADGPGMESGWRCVPVPPDNSGGWVVWDDSSDKKTGWVRLSFLRQGGDA